MTDDDYVTVTRYNFEDGRLLEVQRPGAPGGVDHTRPLRYVLDGEVIDDPARRDEIDREVRVDWSRHGG